MKKNNSKKLPSGGGFKHIKMLLEDYEVVKFLGQTFIVKTRKDEMHA